MAEEELSLLAEIFCFPGELVHWRMFFILYIYLILLPQMK